MINYSRSDWLTIAVSAVAVVLISMVLAMFSLPGEWYAALNKPAFNPPDWLFAPVWTILYVLVAFAGWGAFVEDPFGRAFKVWLLQLVLNWLWSPTFYAIHQMWLALIIIIVMVFLTLYFIMISWRTNRPGAIAMMPYLAWISFATILNIALATLNS